MDNLRAGAMIAGLFFHAALAYSPFLHELWPLADHRTSSAMDAVAWFSHLFRMPLFFLIAGFFAAFLAEKRGIGALIKNRARRILLPFVVFLPLIWISFGAIFGWALSNVQNKSTVLAFIAEMANNPNAPPQEVTTTHLWFLYNLCFFYLAYAGLHAGGVLRHPWLRSLISARSLVWLAPLLVWPALGSQAFPHPAPEQFIPQAWSFAFFGVFFLIGAMLHRHKSALDDLVPYGPWLCLSSVIAYGLVYTQLPPPVRLDAVMDAVQRGLPAPQASVGVALLEAIVAVHMTIVCLVYGRALLNRSSGVARFIADSSYWVYIVHLPVLFWIQFILLDVDWNPWVEFAVSSLGTLTFGLVSYILMVRGTPIGWLLNGQRKPILSLPTSV